MSGSVPLLPYMPSWRWQGLVHLSSTLFRRTSCIRREQMKGKANGRSERRFVLLRGIGALRHLEFIASMVIECELWGISEVIKKGKPKCLERNLSQCHFFPPHIHH